MEITLKQISTRKFILNRILQFFTNGILGICIIFFTTCDSDPPIAANYNVPDFSFSIAHFLIFFCIVAELYFIFTHKSYIKSEIILFRKSIKTKNQIFNLDDLSEILILFNPTKYKTAKRKITTAGGNNWLKFKMKGRKYKLEFFIENSETENRIKELIEIWLLESKVRVGESKPHYFFE